MSPRRPAIESLIGRFYDASLGAMPWSEALDALAVLHNGSSAMAGIERADGQGWGVWTRTDPSYNARFFQQYGGRHPYTQFLRTVPTGTAYADWMAVPKQVFYRTEFYNDWGRPQEKDAALSVVTLRDGEAIGSVVVTRSRRVGEFEARDIELLQRLAPHLRRAFTAYLRLNAALAERAAMADALDAVGQAVLGVDASGRLRFANRTGEELLALRDGLVAERDGGLRAARPADTAALQRLLAEALARNGDASGVTAELRLPRASGLAALVVTALPLSPATADWRGLPGVAALLLVTDPEAAARLSCPDAAALRDRFGLTSAETAVALRVVQGGGVPAAAAALGITPATARSHLRSVFEKTGAHSQAELAWRLARGP